MNDPNDFSPIELLISAFLLSIIVLVLLITGIGMVSDHITLISSESQQLEQNK
jgi:Tfp pilus assembly protein PilV